MYAFEVVVHCLVRRRLRSNHSPRSQTASRRRVLPAPLATIRGAPTKGAAAATPWLPPIQLTVAFDEIYVQYLVGLCIGGVGPWAR